MLFRLCVVLLAIVLFGCTRSEPAPKIHTQATSEVPATGGTAVPSDLALIQGEWKVVKAERDGTAKPDEIGGLVTFDGETAVVRTPSGQVSEFRFVLNADKQSNAIDWIMKEGNETHVLHGLYQLDGDTLVNCSPAGYGLPRPTALETKEGDGRFVFMLKRQASNSNK